MGSIQDVSSFYGQEVMPLVSGFFPPFFKFSQTCLFW